MGIEIKIGVRVTCDITAEDMKPIFNAVYKKRGYLVIGQPMTSARKLKVGETVNKIMQFEYPTDFAIIADTDYKDWLQQGDVIEQLRPDWRRMPSPTVNGYFFRVKPAAHMPKSLTEKQRKALADGK